MEYPAHIHFDDKGKKTIQTVKEHCEAVAKYAGDAVKTVNLYHAAFLAGLLHDMGKQQRLFADYIEQAAVSEGVRKGSVIHTFQGCRYALEISHKKGEPLSQDAIAEEIIAYAVGAHHGLFDCLGGHQKVHGFWHRMTEEGTGYKEARNGFLGLEQNNNQFDDLLQSARSELKDVFGVAMRMAREGAGNYNRFRKIDEEERQIRMMQDFHFYIGLTARLVLSSVIEGDRRDTAHFMNGTEYPVFDGYNRERSLFWEQHLWEMEKKLERFTVDTPLQQARREISDICRNAASGKRGVYRLNVPTGAGKTLSSLRYALAHAAQHGLDRIIFTAPLLSIIDQNAGIIRSYLKDDKVVLEHHSNLNDELADFMKGKASEGTDYKERHDNELERRELLAESWNAPVIITSMVQLLQTFFSGRTSCIRRFQALCNSVIVIDEVQTVPGNMLSLFNLTVNFLSEVCGVTFILCSATQPYFEGAEHPLLRTPAEVVPYSERLWDPFRRTKLLEIPGRKLEEMPDFILQEAKKTHSLLVVCNKKSEAEFLFRSITECGKKCFHLSAAMCMAHRKKTLKEIVEAIENSRVGGESVICVTTQVIEAGVDISFGRVIRFAAGMDSIVQAAGRCNRNGEEPGTSPVYIIDCIDEKLRKLKDIEDGKKAMQELLITYADNPESFDADLSSEKAIRYYYRSLYKGMKEGHQDFSVKSKGRSIFSMMSLNTGYKDDAHKDYDNFYLNQAFAEAGQMFRVFNEDTTDVVIPYDTGEDLIDELQKEHELQRKHLSNPAGSVSAAFMADWLRRAKPYTVSLYNFQKEAIEKKSGLSEIEGVLILQDDFYDKKTGIVNDGGENGLFLEV